MTNELIQVIAVVALIVAVLGLITFIARRIGPENGIQR